MDGFKSFESIIIIAATNHAEVLDKALTRPGACCVFACASARLRPAPAAGYEEGS